MLSLGQFRRDDTSATELTRRSQRQTFSLDLGQVGLGNRSAQDSPLGTGWRLLQSQVQVRSVCSPDLLQQ